MKHQALFSSKDKSKKLKCRLLQFLFGALRVKVYGYIFHFFSFPFNLGQLLEERICSPRSKFFALCFDPILDELYHSGKQIGSHKKDPLVKMAEKDGVVPIHLNK